MLLQHCKIILFPPYLQESRPFICGGRATFSRGVSARHATGCLRLGGRACRSVGTQVMSAYHFQSAGLAFGRTCRAGIASVQDEPVMGFGDNGSREITYQLLFHAVRRGTSIRDESDAVTHAEHMSVYGHGGFFKHDGLDDVGRLTSYAGQLDQLIQIGRNLAVVVLPQFGIK